MSTEGQEKHLVALAPQGLKGPEVCSCDHLINFKSVVPVNALLCWDSVSKPRPLLARGLWALARLLQGLPPWPSLHQEGCTHWRGCNQPRFHPHGLLVKPNLLWQGELPRGSLLLLVKLRILLARGSLLLLVVLRPLLARGSLLLVVLRALLARGSLRLLDVLRAACKAFVARAGSSLWWAQGPRRACAWQFPFRWGQRQQIWARQVPAASLAKAFSLILCLLAWLTVPVPWGRPLLFVLPHQPFQLSQLAIPFLKGCPFFQGLFFFQGRPFLQGNCRALWSRGCKNKRSLSLKRLQLKVVMAPHGVCVCVCACVCVLVCVVYVGNML